MAETSIGIQKGELVLENAPKVQKIVKSLIQSQDDIFTTKIKLEKFNLEFQGELKYRIKSFEYISRKNDEYRLSIEDDQFPGAHPHVTFLKSQSHFSGKYGENPFIEDGKHEIKVKVSGPTQEDLCDSLLNNKEVVFKATISIDKWITLEGEIPGTVETYTHYKDESSAGVVIRVGRNRWGLYYSGKSSTGTLDTHVGGARD